MTRRFKYALSAVAGLMAALVVTACGVSSTSTTSGAAAHTTKALKVGWSTIYLTPSWMQETLKLMQSDAARLQAAGKITGLQVFNANGDDSQQIAQIQAMIQQKYNVIIVDAGSSTALNAAIDQAVSDGITVVNFDSLVNGTQAIKVGTDQQAWGEMMAQWLATELHGKGKIIAMNGPAGVAVSDDRWAGAESVFKKYPGIQIVANVHSEYNVAPAEQAFEAAYAANPSISGVFSQGGALSDAALQTLVQQKKKMVPITGENYNGFLKLWAAQRSAGFSSLATAQPNYLGVIALEAGVAKVEGTAVPDNIVVPLPRIDDANLGQYVKESQPDDYYPIQSISSAAVDQLIGK
jgi:ribose transport system substrate-binding protein